MTLLIRRNFSALCLTDLLVPIATTASGQTADYHPWRTERIEELERRLRQPPRGPHQKRD